MDITEEYKDLCNKYFEETRSKKFSMSEFVFWQLQKIDLNNVKNLKVEETE